MAVLYYTRFQSIALNNYEVELWSDATGTSPLQAFNIYKQRVIADGGYIEDEQGLIDALNLLSGSEELTAQGEGVVIERQGESDTFFDNPIRSSRANAFFVVSTDAQLTAFKAIATDPEGTYALKVYRNNSLLFVGRVLADQMRFERADPDGKVVIEVAAVDALNLLEGFYVQDSWFTNGRASALDIVRKCIELAELDDYTDASSLYIYDALEYYDTAAQTLSDQKLSYFSINKLSLVDNYDPFKEASELVYKPAKKALEQIIGAFGARIFHEAGAFWITQHLAYQSATIVAHTYTKSGSYQGTRTITHGLSLGTLPARPQWAAKPTLYYQPPVRLAESKIKKENGVYEQKTTFNTSVYSLTWSDWREDYPARLRVSVEMAAPSSRYINSLILFYRVYLFDGVDYWEYFQTWTNSGSTLPDYLPEGVKRPTFARKKWQHVMVLDIGGIPNTITATELKVDIYCAEYNPNYTGKGWNPASYTNINFTGTISISQAYNTAEPLEFEKDVKVISENGTSGNSIVKEYESYYYDALRFDLGTIQVYNGSSFVNPTSWANGWEAGYSEEFSQAFADQVTATYNSFLGVIRGTWLDAGGWFAYSSLYFDSGSWLLNGATWSANSERVEGEFLKIAANYTDVVQTGEETDYKPNTDNYLERRLRDLETEISRLNDVQQNAASVLIEDILNASTYAPTSDPGENQTHSVALYYDNSTSLFNWETKQLGSSLAVTSDITSFPIEYELFVCDTSTASITIDLPAPPSVTPGLRFGFVKTNANHSVILDAGAGYQINDAQLLSWSSKWETYWVQSDGTQWYIVASNK